MTAVPVALHSPYDGFNILTIVPCLSDVLLYTESLRADNDRRDAAGIHGERSPFWVSFSSEERWKGGLLANPESLSPLAFELPE